MLALALSHTREEDLGMTLASSVLCSESNTTLRTTTLRTLWRIVIRTVGCFSAGQEARTLLTKTGLDKMLLAKIW